MNTTASNLLKKIRMALAFPTPLPSLPDEEIEETKAHKSFATSPIGEDLVVAFAERFSAVHGKFVFCLDGKELAQNLNTLSRQKQWSKVFCVEQGLQRFFHPDTLHDNATSGEAAVTPCEALLAGSGSLLLGSAKQITALQAPVLICIAHASQLLLNINDWFAKTESNHKNTLPPLVTLVTGPSRIANENESVSGHGPKELYCFLVEGAA